MLIGDIRVDRVEELRTPYKAPAQTYTDFDPDEWARYGVPCDSPEPAEQAGMAHRSWVLRSPNRTVLVDASVGNDKPRPNVPIFDDLTTPYLPRLEAVGVSPEDIDVVVVTHLHIDHVGWNTRYVDGAWVPTFPNATYILPAADVEFFDPINDRRYTRRSDRFMQNVFDDSIRPLLETGQAVTWSDAYDIEHFVRVEAAPGHTPGNAVVKLASGSGRAVFTGDLMHAPQQIALPHWRLEGDEDPEQAVLSRQQVLDWAVAEGALLLPAHFADRAAPTVRRRDGRYTVASWHPIAD